MDFQQKMIEYAKYGISVRTSSNDGVSYYMVTLTFGTKWKIVEPKTEEEKIVMCAKVKEDGTYCYMTETSNGMKPIFDMVDETIAYNEEIEKKVELLKVKAEELKDLFANRTYDELLCLDFVFKKPQEPEQPKTKHSVKSGKKTSQKSKEEPTVKETKPVIEPSGKIVPKTVTEESDIDRKIAAVMK